MTMPSIHVLQKGLPLKYLEAIREELVALELREGKNILQIEINCGTGRTVNSVKFKGINEWELRL